MRPMKTIAAAAAMALALGVGALLPQAAFLVGDRRLAQEVTRREDVRISLVMAEGRTVFESMALLRAPHTEVELSEGNKLTAEQAADAAMEALTAFVLERGAVPTSKAAKAVPVLVTSRDDPAQSGIFWRCSWGEWYAAVEYASPWTCLVWIDDETGKMVGSQGLQWYSPATLDSAEAYSTQMVEYVSLFCQEYYDLAVSPSYDERELIQNGRFSVTLSGVDQEGQEVEYHVPVVSQGGILKLN